MEVNKLFLYGSEAREAMQSLANEKGLVYGTIQTEFSPLHLSPESVYEREKMLLNFFLYERKTWLLNAFELVDGQDTYRYAYMVL